MYIVIFFSRNSILSSANVVSYRTSNGAYFFTKKDALSPSKKEGKVRLMFFMYLTEKLDRLFCIRL